MFHCLASCCADLLIGGPNSQRNDAAWRQVYRALTHGDAKSACLKREMSAFPQEIQDFANQFVTMQRKRHEADYAPDGYYYKSAVSIDIAATRKVIEDFAGTPAKDRRAFAAWVLFKVRNP
jgi:hypothetical protein